MTDTLYRKTGYYRDTGYPIHLYLLLLYKLKFRCVQGVRHSKMQQTGYGKPFFCPFYYQETDRDSLNIEKKYQAQKKILQLHDIIDPRIFLEKLRIKKLLSCFICTISEKCEFLH